MVMLSAEQDCEACCARVTAFTAVPAEQAPLPGTAVDVSELVAGLSRAEALCRTRLESVSAAVAARPSEFADVLARMDALFEQDMQRLRGVHQGLLQQAMAAEAEVRKRLGAAEDVATVDQGHLRAHRDRLEKVLHSSLPLDAMVLAGDKSRHNAAALPGLHLSGTCLGNAKLSLAEDEVSGVIAQLSLAADLDSECLREVVVAAHAKYPDHAVVHLEMLRVMIADVRSNPYEPEFLAVKLCIFVLKRWAWDPRFDAPSLYLFAALVTSDFPVGQVLEEVQALRVHVGLLLLKGRADDLVRVLPHTWTDVCHPVDTFVPELMRVLNRRVLDMPGDVENVSWCWRVHGDLTSNVSAEFEPDDAFSEEAWQVVRLVLPPWAMRSDVRVVIA